MDGQEKRCLVSWLLILHSGHRGEGCRVGLILCRYVRSIGDFPVRSCDRILLVLRGIPSSDLLMVGGCWPSTEFGNRVSKCDCTDR